MKKLIQILAILVLTSILILIIVLVFNPFNSRNKLVGSILNSYLSSNIENYTPLEDQPAKSDSSTQSTTDQHPLLNESQEQTLEDLGVDVSQLPTEVTPEMETCLINAVGETRAQEIIAGDTPSTLEILKAKNCLN